MSWKAADWATDAPMGSPVLKLILISREFLEMVDPETGGNRRSPPHHNAFRAGCFTPDNVRRVETACGEPWRSGE